MIKYLTIVTILSFSSVVLAGGAGSIGELPDANIAVRIESTNEIIETTIDKNNTPEKTVEIVVEGNK